MWYVVYLEIASSEHLLLNIHSDVAASSGLEGGRQALEIFDQLQRKLRAMGMGGSHPVQVR